ncbi:MAG: radical SAM protein [Deltaproteobacteria bacterium]|nr:radical SAM protein [Deltaproteobacteria bacterium]
MRKRLRNPLKLARAHGKVILRNAYLLPVVARSYFRLLVLRKPTLRGVEFAITYRCQCRCSHCLKDTLIDAGRAELNPAEIGRAVRGMANVGLLFCNLTGGEALLRQDFYEIVGACRPRKLFVTLASNGKDVDRAKVRRLKAAGIRMVTFSLDSAEATAHDKGRGCDGVFADVVTGVEACRAEGIPVFINAIATHENVSSGDLNALTRLVAGWDALLTINLPYLVGSWHGRTDLLLDEDEMARVREIMELPHVRWEGSSNYLTEGCPAGTEKVYVTPYGDVMPCAAIHASYGNVREEPFETIYLRMRRTPIFCGANGPCLTGGNRRFQCEALPEINRLAYEGKDPRKGVEVLERLRREDYEKR